MDGINNYSCKCGLGFSGQYCQFHETILDIPPSNGKDSAKNSQYFLKRAADESSRQCNRNNCKNVIFFKYFECVL